MTLIQFFNLIKKIYGPRRKGLRLGQHAYIHLYNRYKDIAGIICGNDNLDPFYADSRLDTMLIFILKNYVEDLNVIIVAGIEIRPTVFPDKTTQVWKLTEEQLKCNKVVWVYEGDYELVPILQLGALLTANSCLRKSNDLILTCSQFPYARQDKSVSNENTFGLSTLLKSLIPYYDIIQTFDVHNPTFFEYNFQKLENRLPKDIIATVVEDEKIDIIIYPDAGAAVRYSHLSDKEFVCADKVRDQLTGEITGLSMPEIKEGLNILVVDDIADGAKTFLVLAELINKYNPAKLILYVSHGIFSKGTKIVHDAGYSKIFDKNGIFSVFPFFDT
jgi:ribose-phosphate pyrophosphokinase